MDTAQLRAALLESGARVTAVADPRLGIAPHLLRVDAGGRVGMAVGGELALDAKVAAVAELVLLGRSTVAFGPLDLYLGRTEDGAAAAAVALLCQRRLARMVALHLDLDPTSTEEAPLAPPAPIAAEVLERWSRPPAGPLVDALEPHASALELVWARDPDGGLSGRVDGLPVLALEADGARGSLGAPPGVRWAHDLERVTEGRLGAVTADTPDLRARLEAIVDARREGVLADDARAERLADRVMSGRLRARWSTHDLRGVALELPFAEGHRPLPLLARAGEHGLAVEVVVSRGSRLDASVRAALARAALATELLREGPAADWIRRQGLEPAALQAAVLMPKLTSARARERLPALLGLAAVLDVALVLSR